MIWLGSVYFSGGYDENQNIRRLGRGLLVGTVLLAAVYGFLDMEYRSSRALIVLGAVWALLSTLSIRFLLHFIRFGNFNVGRERPKNLVIVGTVEESKRVVQLIHQAQVQKNIIGTVAPAENPDSKLYLSSLNQLTEVVHIYKIDEIIFCAQDISSQEIMHWMTALGPAIAYRIVPEESLSIIGSSSKNSAGELYTIEIRFQIAHYMNRRNKRLLDLGLSLFFLFTLPIHLLFIKSPLSFIKNLFTILFNRKSWVGYSSIADTTSTLPSIKPGVLNPTDALDVNIWDEATIQRLNFLYAKDYRISSDLDIIWRGYGTIGKE